VVLSLLSAVMLACSCRSPHVEATGAPRVFVHVFFNELPPGVAYSAGEIDTTISGIQGAIRAGRPFEVRQKLIKQISAAWSKITGQPEKQVLAGPGYLTFDRPSDPVRRLRQRRGRHGRHRTRP
jgi:phenylpyruvate tautomerase PptA (4-oxalocrotonate tautomerase family)